MNSLDRQEAIRRTAEKMKQKREKEERESEAFYQRITTGKQWGFFKIVVLFSTLMMLITTIETYVDGPSEKLTENDWHINREWEWRWHQILDVKGYMFSPFLRDWLDHEEESLTLIYSPIFKTGKKLSYNVMINETAKRPHVEWRQRSIFNWFPFLQIFLLIPLFTYFFKRRSPWFIFARFVSLAFVIPGTLMIIFFTLL